MKVAQTVAVLVATMGLAEIYASSSSSVMLKWVACYDSNAEQETYEKWWSKSFTDKKLKEN